MKEDELVGRLFSLTLSLTHVRATLGNAVSAVEVKDMEWAMSSVQAAIDRVEQMSAQVEELTVDVKREGHDDNS